MGLSDLVSYTAIVLYAVGAAFAFAGTPSEKRHSLTQLSLIFSLAGFVLHSGLMLLLVLTKPLDGLSKGDLLQLLSWSVLLVWWISWRWLRLPFLALTMAPLALLLYIASLGVERVRAVMPPELGPLFALLHMGSLFVSFALLALGFGAGLLFLRVNAKLKGKAAFSDFDRELPALSTFDAVNKWVVAIGFPLYTLGVASGFFWARITWGRTISWDPKELFSFFVWCLFAVLFHQRLALGWQGKKAALMLIGIFALSVFSVAGINFFMDSHHSFFGVR
jgi:ABC-type transport system involved in cytochrome c biogenesis permease subunit